VALESLGPTTVAGWESKAQAGDALAQNVVGMAYKYGIGTEQNHAVSLAWFRKAADQGDADAQFNLGRIYGKATGTYATMRAAPQDDVEAVKWYRRSAEQDYRPAQFNLAEIYAEGSGGVPRDDVLAYFWMSLAASGGDQAAAQKLERYAAHLSAAQIDSARGLVADWKRRRGSK
jgi:TPR repeat protein